jgi:hypothetical protein
MRSETLVGTSLVIGLFAVGTVVASGDVGSPVRQSAIIYMTAPTLIGSTIVKGPVVFIHDNAKMARGEPCTTVRLFEPWKRPAEDIASFHCIPTPRKPVHKFTVTTRPNVELGFGCVLTEFQFAGDWEGHVVPDSLPVLASTGSSTETGQVP